METYFEVIGTSRQDIRGSIMISSGKGTAYDIAQYLKKDYSSICIIERKGKYPALKGASINVQEIYNNGGV